jgi:hypothetical protein
VFRIRKKSEYVKKFGWNIYQTRGICRIFSINKRFHISNPCIWVQNLAARNLWKNFSFELLKECTNKKLPPLNVSFVLICVKEAGIAQSGYWVGYGLESGDRNPTISRNTVLATALRRAIRPTKTLIQWTPGYLSVDKETGTWSWPLFSILCRG